MPLRDDIENPDLPETLDKLYADLKGVKANIEGKISVLTDVEVYPENKILKFLTQIKDMIAEILNQGPAVMSVMLQFGDKFPEYVPYMIIPFVIMSTLISAIAAYISYKETTEQLNYSVRNATSLVCKVYMSILAGIWVTSCVLQNIKNFADNYAQEQDNGQSINIPIWAGVTFVFGPALLLGALRTLVELYKRFTATDSDPKAKEQFNTQKQNYSFLRNLFCCLPKSMAKAPVWLLYFMEEFNNITLILWPAQVLFNAFIETPQILTTNIRYLSSALIAAPLALHSFTTPYRRLEEYGCAAAMLYWQYTEALNMQQKANNDGAFLSRANELFMWTMLGLIALMSVTVSVLLSRFTFKGGFEHSSPLHSDRSSDSDLENLSRPLLELENEPSAHCFRNCFNN